MKQVDNFGSSNRKKNDFMTVVMEAVRKRKLMEKAKSLGIPVEELEQEENI